MSGKDEELEVKFYISKRKELEEKVLALGGQLEAPRVREVNLRFDTPEQTLAESGRLLRLRMDTRARLTYKGPGGVEGGARLREELEFTVSDFETAKKLLEALGYQVQMMYEKYRITYRLADLEIVLDEMPYGDFVEIEGGDGESIQKAAEKLGLDWDSRILASYTVLFEVAREVLGFEFRDLSFENFEGMKISPAVLEVKIADKD
jgi:adenylate cyclase class 2